MPEITGYVSRTPNSGLSYPQRTIMDQFDFTNVFPNDNVPCVLSHYGLGSAEDNEFFSYDTNPYNGIVESWTKWGSIGDRLIAAQIFIDGSSSQSGNEEKLHDAVVNAVKALRSDKYDFTESTWIRVVVFNGKGLFVLIDWCPVEDVNIDTIPPVVPASNTPLSSANMLAVGSLRNFAAAAKVHSDKLIIGCNLVMTDGQEVNSPSYTAPFTADDVKEYTSWEEFVDSARTVPLLHALHSSMVYIGMGNLIADCEGYAERAGYAFDYMKELTVTRLTNWFVDKIHTASALGGSNADDEDDEGILNFAAMVDDEDPTDDVFRQEG